MADLLPTPPPAAQATGADRDTRYEPVSAIAVVAIVVASIFALLTASLTIIGLVTRRPVLEFGLILLAILGIVLAMAARWHIRIAEGTRAGQKIANLAWWMCLIGGLIYSAYFIGSQYAVRRQANDFTLKWLDKVKSGKVDEAYYDTITPEQRRGMSLADMRLRFSDSLAMFKLTELIRLYERAGDKISVEIIGAKDLKSAGRSFQVPLEVRVRTPEGEFDILVIAASYEGKEVAGRQWYVKYEGNPFVARRRYTKLGRYIHEMTSDADRFLREWTMGKAEFRPEQWYFDTLVPETREKMNSEYVSRVFLHHGLAQGTTPGGNLVGVGSNLVCLLTSPRTYRESHLPGYDQVGQRMKFVESGEKIPIGSERAEVLPKLVRAPLMSLSSRSSTAEVPVELRISKGEIRGVIGLDFVLPAPRSYRCRGHLHALLHAPEVVAEVNKLQEADWRTAELYPDTTVPLFKPGKSIGWQIIQIDINYNRALDDQRPGGGTPMMPGMPGGPPPPGGAMRIDG